MEVTKEPVQENLSVNLGTVYIKRKPFSLTLTGNELVWVAENTKKGQGFVDVVVTVFVCLTFMQ